MVLALLAGYGIAVSQARRSAAERDRALELLRRAEATNDFSNILMSQATPRAAGPSRTSSCSPRART